MDATQRFTSRVDNYVRYRPSYPHQVLDTLREECRLTRESVIADVGSGTGILSVLFLKNGNRVFGIEPNCEMREAAEQFLSADPNFNSIDGTAEATTLPAGSVDFVTAGQSFHWFDPLKARIEFSRILKPQGWVILVWNERLMTTPFLQAYERILRAYSVDYGEVDHRQIDANALTVFFGSTDFFETTYPNRQNFDLEGLKGRLLSSSYTPEAGDPRYLPMLAELENAFRTHQLEGRVAFEYQTIMYCGQLHRH